jgi:hypothetical protein
MDPATSGVLAGPSTPTMTKKAHKKKLTEIPIPPVLISGEGGTSRLASAPAQSTHLASKWKVKEKVVAKVSEMALAEPATSDGGDDLPPAKKSRVQSEEI